MSTVAEKAAARRAKILARSGARMAVVSGGHAAGDLLESSSPSPPAPLDSDAASRELERALEEISAQEAPIASASLASVDSAADPHEFLSAADARSFTPPPSPPSAGMDSALAFRSFGGAAAAAAARRSKPIPAYELDLPPEQSALQQWQRRATKQLRAVSPARGVTVAFVVVSAALAGLGFIEGGLAWLLLIELLSVATASITALASSSKSAAVKSKPSTASRPASSAAAAASDDSDVIDVDTDTYRAQPASSAQDPLAGLMASAMSMSPALDSGLKALQLAMKYAAAMKQLMHDAFLFVFISVAINAAAQCWMEEKIVYVD